MPEARPSRHPVCFCFGTEDIASAHERAVLHGMNPSDISRTRTRAISTFTIRTVCPCRCVNTVKGIPHN